MASLYPGEGVSIARWLGTRADLDVVTLFLTETL